MLLSSGCLHISLACPRFRQERESGVCDMGVTRSRRLWNHECRRVTVVVESGLLLQIRGAIEPGSSLSQGLSMSQGALIEWGVSLSQVYHGVRCVTESDASQSRRCYCCLYSKSVGVRQRGGRYRWDRGALIPVHQGCHWVSASWNQGYHWFRGAIDSGESLSEVCQFSQRC
jgi:hypothetical protein